MVYAQDTTFGIETKIKLIQNALNSKLVTLWGANTHVYGLIQEINKDGKIIPTVYTDKGEYKELFLDDNKTTLIAFLLKDRQSHTATIEVIFNCNLKSINTNDKRQKEKVLKEAFQRLRTCGYVSSVTGMKEGVQDVYTGFEQSQLINKDMEPFYVFSVECEIVYSMDL